MSKDPYSIKRFSLARLKKDGNRITYAYLMYGLKRVLTYIDDEKGIRMNIAKGMDMAQIQDAVDKIAPFYISHLKKVDPSYDGTFGIKEFIYTIARNEEVANKCSEYYQAYRRNVNRYKANHLHLVMIVLWTKDSFRTSYFTYFGSYIPLLDDKAEAIAREMEEEHRAQLKEQGLEDKGDYYAEVWDSCPRELSCVNIELRFSA